MATKTKTLRVSFPHYDDTKEPGTERYNAPRVYQVVQVTDSVEYVPDQQLSKKQVDELCSAHDWKVTIVTSKE